MIFWIQAGNPSSVHSHSVLDANLSDAMETVFPLFTESAVLSWNAVHVPLSYKYDIGLMILDIIEICQKIISQPDLGSIEVQWPSNTFNSSWKIEWSRETLRVHAQFYCVAGGVERVMNAFPTIEMLRLDFLSEWKMPMEYIISALKASKYTKEQIPEYQLLEDTYNAIPIKGILYRCGHEQSKM